MTTKRLKTLFPGCAAGLMLITIGWFPSSSGADDLADRAGVVKPTATELAWLKIPWVLDLKAAQQTAQAEGRPIFLWVTGDDPLERC
jgi:hypothetical protein